MSRVNGRLSEDARMELAMAASARERRNRPVGLVMLAIALFAGAAIAASVGLGSRRDAVGDLRRALEDQASAERMVQEWRALTQREQASGAQQVGQPLPNLRSMLESLSRQARMQTPPIPTGESSDRQGPVMVRTWFYNEIRDPSLQAILEWLRLATVDPVMKIPGLEVYRLELKPGPDAWSASLTLRRWERAG